MTTETEILVRTGAFVLVAAAAFLWPRDLRRYWHEWTPRARRVTMSVMSVFFANGISILNAAYTGRPVAWTLGLLMFAYGLVVVALLWPDKER